eukprot:TRINITY_DN4665_c0_g2_i1.p1 TRINITY_DN4665_c0_g2~~TRINITY_DN4665_c0_g2_i1.p1  ORF type:complete len:263 (+),score=32.20 TRINITY_DN4665_c0_g2_i1:209-997(+)
MRTLQFALIVSLVHVGVGVRREAEEEDQVDGDDDQSTLGPGCSKAYSVNEFVSKVTRWCDPLRVPATIRAPEKLQGLFWLKDLPLPDVMACLSTGLWNQSSRTLTLRVWKDFVVQDTLAGKALITGAHLTGISYAIKFHDDSLTNATIKPFASGTQEQKQLGFIPMKGFGLLWKFDLLEDQSAPSGDRWSRPCKLFKVLKVFTYDLWRLMDANHKVNPEHNEAMIQKSKWWFSRNVRLYWDASPEATCDAIDPTEHTVPVGA